jgi:WD40 repeat protein
MKTLLGFTTLLAFFLLQSSAHAATGSCTTAITIIDRIGALQSKIDHKLETGDTDGLRTLFAALQSRIRMAKKAGIEIPERRDKSTIESVRTRVQEASVAENDSRRASSFDWTQSAWSNETPTISFSPSGRFTARKNFDDGTVVIENAKTGNFIGRILVPVLLSSRSEMTFLDDRTIAFNDFNGGDIVLYDFGRPPVTLNSPVTRQVLASRDGQKILSEQGTDWVLLDRFSGDELGRAHFPKRLSASADFTGNRIVVVSHGTAIVYDFKRKKEIAIDVGPVTSARLTPDGKRLLTAGNSLSLWSVGTRNKIRDYDTRGRGTMAAEIRNGGRTIVAFPTQSFQIEGPIQLFDLETGVLEDGFEFPARIDDYSISESTDVIAIRHSRDMFHFENGRRSRR